MSDRAVGIAPRIKEQIRGYTAGGMEPEVIGKILRGYFTGQRDGMRTYKFLEVKIQGNGGTFQAVAVDISRSGMLFRITDDSFASENRCHPLMPYTARVWHNFEGGFQIHFEGGAFTVPASIVRVTGYMIRLADVRRFREEGSRTNTTVLGSEAIATTGILKRRPRVVGHELHPSYDQ